MHFVGLQEIMVEECSDSLLSQFDTNQDFLWLWNLSKGKLGGILVGVKNEFYDVGSFRQGISCFS
jgi:hypothetical protein